MPSRKCTFKLYPNATEVAALERALAAHCKVYNTVLEMSRLRHRAGLPAYTRTSVNQATKVIRNSIGWIAENTLAQSLQVTGERVVKAFDKFFQRVADGEPGGYPRFKSMRRFPGWGYKAQGGGYRLHRKAGDHQKYGAVTLSGVGTISLRGRARFQGSPTSAEVVRKGGCWYLSVTFDVEAEQLARPCAKQGPFAFDVGLTELLTTLKYHDGQAVWDSVENPRWLKRQLGNVVELQRTVSALEQEAIESFGRNRGFPAGGKLKAAYARLRSVHQKVRNQREDFYHKLSAWLASQYEHIITEELSVSSMQIDTAKSSPLKRSVSDAAWGSFLAKLRCKAEEAGTKFEQVPTRRVKPTRRCSCCGDVKERADMALSQRMFVCSACGFTLERDRNACRNMVRWSFEGSWWGKKFRNGPGTGPETPCEKAPAPAQVE